jgi:hypothetical protein
LDDEEAESFAKVSNSPIIIKESKRDIEKLSKNENVI